MYAGEIKTTLHNIENYLSDLNSWIGSGAANIVPTINRSKEKYQEELSTIDFIQFVHQGNYHFFISRVLFLSFDRGYSRFAAHQCIESYLKAFVRKNGEKPKKSHDLIYLLSDCRKMNPSHDDFINSDNIYTIAYKYNIEYEIPRYPVTHVEWKGHASMYPDDVFVLDYFVYKMMKTLDVENLKEGMRKGVFIYFHELFDNKEPELVKIFNWNNIVIDY